MNDVRIKQISNGFIVTITNGDGSDTVVFKDETVSFMEMLYELKDYYGYYEDKYSNEPDNIVISRHIGHKNDDELENICKKKLDQEREFYKDILVDGKLTGLDAFIAGYEFGKYGIGDD